MDNLIFIEEKILSAHHIIFYIFMYVYTLNRIIIMSYINIYIKNNPIVSFDALSSPHSHINYTLFFFNESLKKGVSI